jgi:hypothetical protein
MPVMPDDSYYSDRLLAVFVVYGMARMHPPRTVPGRRVRRDFIGGFRGRNALLKHGDDLTPLE